MGPRRDATARGDRAAVRPLRRRHHPEQAHGRLPRDHQEGRSCSAAATRSSRAVTANTAMSCSTSSRCRAARASPSTEEIKGGVVPRNYIPSVEEGVVDALKHGPLGFPVVDITAKLVDGSYHTVDSSDMAFQLAGRLAIHEGLPQCQPVLLEPIYQVEIVCPSEATAKMNALMSGRRGQILGFDTREGWDGWDVVRVQMPEVGDRRSDRRGALGDRWRRQLHVQVRSHGRTRRPHRRPDRGGAKARLRPEHKADDVDARTGQSGAVLRSRRSLCSRHPKARCASRLL